MVKKNFKRTNKIEFLFRNPRLFFATISSSTSSTTTTATITTASLCYTTASGKDANNMDIPPVTTPCSGRKKRRVIEYLDESTADIMAPTQVHRY